MTVHWISTTMVAIDNLKTLRDVLTYCFSMATCTNMSKCISQFSQEKVSAYWLCFMTPSVVFELKAHRILTNHIISSRQTSFKRIIILGYLQEEAAMLINSPIWQLPTANKQLCHVWTIKCYSYIGRNNSNISIYLFTYHWIM